MDRRKIQGRKVRKELIPYIKDVLRAHHIYFKVVDEQIFTSLSSNQYHRFIERAMCVQQQKGSPIPVISFGEYIHEELPRCFSILEKDKDKYLAEIR